MSLEKKIDFTVFVGVHGANPNGDPLNGNRPRQTSDGFGEISDVAIKRKIRNRLQDMGYKIFVQSADKTDDGYKSLKDRADSIEELKKAYKEKDADTYSKIACKEWIDVRSFGQLFAFKKDEKQASGVSIGVRGPVSIQIARSTDPIFINEMQIIKSVNSTTSDKKTSDTMGMKYSIDFAVYKFSGSINVQLAEKTGFSEEDAEAIHKALETLFVNDESSARPAGSMEVLRVYWWKHNSKLGQHSPAEMNRAVEIKNNNEPNAPRSLDDIEFIDKTPEDMKENEQIYEG